MTEIGQSDGTWDGRRRIPAHRGTSRRASRVTTRGRTPARRAGSRSCSLRLAEPLLVLGVHRSTLRTVHPPRCTGEYPPSGESLSRRFAGEEPDESSRASRSVRRGPAPRSWRRHGLADCRVHAVHPAGDHSIFVGEVLAGDAHRRPPSSSARIQPLCVVNGGHTPVRAPRASSSSAQGGARRQGSRSSSSPGRARSPPAACSSPFPRRSPPFWSSARRRSTTRRWMP